jgi:hypothetical protein
MKPHCTLTSLEITNMYSNIPVKETKKILSKFQTQSSVTPKTKKEVLKWYDIITRQNYFAYKDRIIFQQDRLAMGAPSSGFIVEFFVQHLKHSHLPQLTQKHRLINYW